MRDRFAFRISAEGKLYPNGGKDSALYLNQIPLESNYSYWKNATSSSESCDEHNYETGCAARIMENGWKMDY